MRKVILIFFLFPVFQISAQSMYGTSKTYVNNRNTIEQFREDKEGEGGFITSKNLKYDEIEGTPFFNNQFVKGKIALTDGTQVEDCLLRYNVYTDQLENQIDGIVYEVSPKSKVLRARFDNHIFACVKFQEKNRDLEGYFEVLTEGKLFLLKKYSVKFVPPTPSSAYAEAKSAHFEAPKILYYVAQKDGEVILLKNKKTLLNLFIDDKDAMANFYLENKMSVQSETDLLKIISLYNNH